MKKRKKADYIIIFVLVIIIGLIVFVNILGNDTDENQGTVTENIATKISDFDGHRLGIKVGSSFEQPTMENFPNSEYDYLDTDSDLLLALQSGKIDGFIEDEPVVRLMCMENSELAYFVNPINKEDYHLGFPKDDAKSEVVKKQFNELLKKLWNNGEIDRLIYKWIDGPEEQKVLDDYNLSGSNGELIIAIQPDHPPFTYYKDNKLVGYLVELSLIFGKEYGYSIRFEGSKISSMIVGLSTGKYDIAASAMTMTEERSKSIDFSDVIYHGGMMFVTRASSVNGSLVRSNDSDNENSRVSDFNGRIIGIKTGSAFEPVTFEKFPKSEYKYFDTDTDLMLALQEGKIDGFIDDEPVAKMMCNSNKELAYFTEPLVIDNYSFAFKKDSERAKNLMKQFNEMLNELWTSGEIDRLINKWTIGPEEERTIDDTGLTGENGEISAVILADTPPFAYYYNNKLTGYSIELCTLFAVKYGYKIKFEETKTASIIAGITGGKNDIGAANFSITEERKKSLSFSDTIYKGGMVLVVRNEDVSGYNITSFADSNESKSSNNGKTEKNFWDKFVDSFKRNFIQENRWQMILKGVGITCLITVLSVLFGSVLAFLICMLRRVDSEIAGGICNLYVKLLQGTPVLVLLMILYYIVFGKSGIEGLWVAVIAFSLNFGAYGSEIMKSGIESIDKGQREAALALGFTENKAFFKFIFPQAAVRFLPVYKQEIISLLKNTSIVGYIAINDLTKVSDIIRSRTFEAFFPLLTSAVIYFILAWVISVILKKILKCVDPKQKKKTVKGVTMN